MKLLFHKLTSLLLSILVLVATTTLTASTHYCGKNLVSFEINKPVKSCCLKFRKNKSDKLLLKKSCCHDFSFTKKASDEVVAAESHKSKQVSISIKKIPAFVSVALLFDIESIDSFEEDTFLQNFQPLSQDRTILFQVFII